LSTAQKHNRQFSKHNWLKPTYQSLLLLSSPSSSPICLWRKHLRKQARNVSTGAFITITTYSHTSEGIRLKQNPAYGTIDQMPMAQLIKWSWIITLLMRAIRTNWYVIGLLALVMHTNFIEAKIQCTISHCKCIINH